VSELSRDLLIQEQPILWAQTMLMEAEKAGTEDARDAILARVGMTLYSRFGVTFAQGSLRRANQQWERLDLHR
jgi:hypothetical protein